MAKVYLLAATKLAPGWDEFLNDLGHTKWVGEDEKDADLLAETAGRLCYRSWAPYSEADSEASKRELNANVKKVRHGNEGYLANILSSGHGSVFEHINFTFLLRNVSRVLTHELVRHRAGMAYSQESLRYCRLEHLEIIIPREVNIGDDALEIMENVAEVSRCAVAKLNTLLLDPCEDFATKKKITSLIRRIAPIGVSTNIIFTANTRALRHLIQMRTNPAAEVEIRTVFRDVAKLAVQEAPNVFQDMEWDDKTDSYSFESAKI